MSLFCKFIPGYCYSVDECSLANVMNIYYAVDKY